MNKGGEEEEEEECILFSLWLIRSMIARAKWFFYLWHMQQQQYVYKIIPTVPVNVFENRFQSNFEILWKVKEIYNILRRKIYNIYLKVMIEYYWIL